MHTRRIFHYKCKFTLFRMYGKSVDGYVDFSSLNVATDIFEITSNINCLSNQWIIWYTRMRIREHNPMSIIKKKQRNKTATHCVLSSYEIFQACYSGDEYRIYQKWMRKNNTGFILNICIATVWLPSRWKFWKFVLMLVCKWICVCVIHLCVVRLSFSGFLFQRAKKLFII